MKQSPNSEIASTWSISKFGSSCAVYLAVVQVEWGCIGWELWNYLETFILLGQIMQNQSEENHAKPIWGKSRKTNQEI